MFIWYAELNIKLNVPLKGYPDRKFVVRGANTGYRKSYFFKVTKTFAIYLIL